MCMCLYVGRKPARRPCVRDTHPISVHTCSHDSELWVTPRIGCSQAPAGPPGPRSAVLPEPRGLSRTGVPAGLGAPGSRGFGPPTPGCRQDGSGAGPLALARLRRGAKWHLHPQTPPLPGCSRHLQTAVGAQCRGHEWGRSRGDSPCPQPPVPRNLSLMGFQSQTFGELVSLVQIPESGAWGGAQNLPLLRKKPQTSRFLPMLGPRRHMGGLVGPHLSVRPSGCGSSILCDEGSRSAAS